ncbi:unnamed protein product [Microthlaspi erraticum]|uniref:Uncharacterized protein n=1 Tax=Microthlaspi erraticum TaxID=1685480 RepID=A0A6D2IQ20_9BRAS|nr:unnamed protein product [Microthlaspi erraticum]
MKLRRAKEINELSSTQMEAKIKTPSSTTWRSYSTHSELSTKNNQTKRSSYEADIEDTFWKIFNAPDGDMRSLIEAFRPNQDEPSFKSNYYRFYTHHRNTESWIRFNRRSDQGVIDFTNRVNRSFPDLDPGAHIGRFRSNQKDLGYEPTWYGILNQPGRYFNWIYSNTGFGLRVIQLLNQTMLNLPYLEAHGFNHLQTRLWRPGERSNHSGETSTHLGDSYYIFPCTSTHRIRRILMFVNFPFPDAFTLGSIYLQRLYLQDYSDLSTGTLHLDVPRHQSFTPKLSRLKHHPNLPYLAEIIHLSLQRLVP